MTKLKPQWGHVPLLDVKPSDFKKDDKIQLRDTLAAAGLAHMTEALIFDLEEQLSQFVAYEKCEKDLPKRSEMLAALKEIDTYANGLSKRLGALNSRSRDALAPLLPVLLSAIYNPDEIPCDGLNALATSWSRLTRR